jgi:hypothetical protein
MPKKRAPNPLIGIVSFQAVNENALSILFWPLTCTHSSSKAHQMAQLDLKEALIGLIYRLGEAA